MKTTLFLTWGVVEYLSNKYIFIGVRGVKLSLGKTISVEIITVVFSKSILITVLIRIAPSYYGRMNK